MNILVIGNGFDLAHGLPTRYTDFLKWIVGQHDFFYTLKKQDSQITKLRECISLRIPEEANRKVISQRITHQEEIWNCIDDNFWIGYFLQNPMYQKENWIDFENEISKVIKSVDADMKGNIEKKISYEKLSNEYLKDCFMTYDDLFERVDGVEEDTPRKSFGELRDKLLNDLNKLIRALEIYLTEYVERIDCQLISPDIQRIKIF